MKLQVDCWGNWEEINEFRTLLEAQLYAREHFSGNSWRVIDSRGRLMDFFNPYEEIARQELARFDRTEQFIVSMVERNRINREIGRRARFLKRSTSEEEVCWFKEGF